MICPCCKNIIKSNEERITCFRCETPHHKSCWENHNGCCTSDCYENPAVKSKAENVGNRTLDEILGAKNSPVDNSIASALTPVQEPEEQFQQEFKSRYREKLDFKMRRRIILFSSIGIIAALIIVSAVFTYIKINEYFSSENYAINTFLKSWESAWESRDILMYRDLLDKDYKFIDKNNKSVSFDDRIKSMAKTFESSKKIFLKVRDTKIEFDSVNAGYVNVEFQQILTIDKKEEKGVKVLRLYKNPEQGNRWLVFREYYEKVY